DRRALLAVVPGGVEAGAVQRVAQLAASRERPDVVRIVVALPQENVPVALGCPARDIQAHPLRGVAESAGPGGRRQRAPRPASPRGERGGPDRRPLPRPAPTPALAREREREEETAARKAGPPPGPLPRAGEGGQTAGRKAGPHSGPSPASGRGGRRLGDA